MERRWMLLVESFRLVEQIQHFIDDSKTRPAVTVAEFLPRGVFDEDATRVMGEAFDSAVAGLQDRFHANVIYEVIARRIIAAARKGERDPTKLRNVAIGAIQRIVDNGK
jgi:predicted ester cyclase